MKAISIIFAALLISSCSEKPTISAAWTLCQYTAKGKLASPSTAKFPSSVDIKSKIRKKDTYSRFTFNGYVDAQNKFSATIRKKFTCVVKGSRVSKKLKWDVLSFNFTS